MSSLLPSRGQIVRVEHDQRVQETRRDEERVAVLEGDRGDLTAAPAAERRDDAEQTEHPLGAGREYDERLTEVEWKKAAVETQAKPEHQTQHRREDHRLLHLAV